LASGAVRFGRIAADESNVGVLAVYLDRIAVDNIDISWIDWLGVGGCDKEQRSDAG
jgi:hypothetical protein